MLSWVVCCAGALLSCLVVVSGRGEPPASYTLDLDLPPLERWNHIGKNYAQYSEGYMEMLGYFIGSKQRLQVAIRLAEIFHGFMRQPYKDELESVAKAMNTSLGAIVIGNLYYSINANSLDRFGRMCTSIVAVDKHNDVMHARNMDFDEADMLKKMTATVRFQRKGKTAYIMTGFIGQVGFYTAMKPGLFSITLDERQMNDWWMAVLEVIKDGRNAHLPSFLIRDVLEEETSFDAAVSRFRDTHQVAPSYYIVAGTGPQQGAIVTHGRAKTPDVYYLNQTTDKWFTVETNYDHWTPAPAGDDRRDVAIAGMRKVGRADISLDTIHKVLSIPPVLNAGTIYTTLMSPAKEDSYRSYMH